MMILLRNIMLLAVSVTTLLLTGCDPTAPRARMGSLATATPGIPFRDPNSLGKHSYGYHPFETNGIVYTCKAGHIDITHLRWNADYTRYLTRRIKDTLLKDKKGFSFNLALEISVHKLEFEYPDNWNDLSIEEKTPIAEDIAAKIGPYVAFNATLWHEILTWHHVHFVGFEPEFNSSFCWEDMYSNLLGTELAAEVVSDPNNHYDEALTDAINQRLKDLDVQSGQVARRASESVRGTWYKGNFNIVTMKKNFDVGYDDGYVTPILIPGICPDAEPVPLAVPTTNVLDEYGFSMIYSIRPQEFERRKILKVVYPEGGHNAINVEEHMPIYIEHIKKEAAEIHNYIVD